MDVSTADYSPLQRERMAYRPELPAAFATPGAARRVLRAPAAGVDSELRAWLPHTLAAPASPLVAFEPAGAGGAGGEPSPSKPLRVGVVFCGRQCPGGHNVVAGLFDALQQLAPGSALLGFVGGTRGLFDNKTIELTAENLAPYRNQVRREKGARENAENKNP